MAKEVEERLIQMLAEARNGTPEKEGAKEYKLLKDRNVSLTPPLCTFVRRSHPQRIMTDVWS